MLRILNNYRVFISVIVFVMIFFPKLAYAILSPRQPLCNILNSSEIYICLVVAIICFGAILQSLFYPIKFKNNFVKGIYRTIFIVSFCFCVVLGFNFMSYFSLGHIGCGEKININIERIEKYSKACVIEYTYDMPWASYRDKASAHTEFCNLEIGTKIEAKVEFITCDTPVCKANFRISPVTDNQ